MRLALRCAIPVLFCAIGHAPAEILLNEVLYDPAGADSGFEFVELSGEAAASAEGLCLEFCNGSDPGSWQRLWTGQADDRLGADGLFLIGESSLVESPDAVVSLGLQNGPDALRLTRQEQTLDLLGYGEGLPGSLCEAWPAADTPSGKSLARIPDGMDTDQNALDFFASEPSPGRLNDPDLALRIREVRLPMPPPPAGEAWTLRVELENTGRLAWPGSVELRAGAAAECSLRPLESGSRAWAELSMPASPAGVRDLNLSALGESPFLADSLHLSYRVDLGAMWLTEVQFAPEPSRSEWVECLAPLGLDSAGFWRLRDLDGYEASFQIPALGPGERVLLCRDREALLAEHGGLPAARVIELPSWPSLSNSGENAAWPPWTDGLRLIDAAGLDSDGMLYRGDWIDRNGQSLERLYSHGPPGASAWAVCPSGSSPLAGPSPSPEDPRPGWSLRPQPFDPAKGAVEFFKSAPGGAARLRLFDAAGRGVQELSGNLGPGSLRLLWDGRDRRGRNLPSGAYPFLLSWDDTAGVEHFQRGCCLILRSDS